MGDTQDGSTGAAQGALADGGDETGPRPGPEPGFLKKILNAFGGADGEQAEGGKPETPALANGVVRPLLGLGNLRRLRVEDVMLPKAEIVAVPVDITKPALVEVFRESGMTRLPVYENTLDTPLGLVHLKDFALSHGFNGTGERYNLKKMLRPLLYAPPSMPIGVLLQKMQTGRMHMALVIDEYGGVDGLVTIEDLIEQVIGEIEDEHDTEDARPFTLEKPGCYLALARTPLDEFEAEIGRKLVDAEDEEEIDTLGGLVFMLAGRIPARGEVVHHPDGPDFEVVDADPRRIKRLRVRLAGAGNA
jgi:magnesium and cobalt transporter